jgi:glycyl-tRNA synthetase (class II)
MQLQVDLTAYESFPEPRMVEMLEIKPDKKALGKDFKKDASPIGVALEALTECDAMELKAKIEAGETVSFSVGSANFDINKSHVGRSELPFPPCLLSKCFIRRAAEGIGSHGREPLLLN